MRMTLQTPHPTRLILPGPVSPAGSRGKPGSAVGLTGRCAQVWRFAPRLHCGEASRSDPAMHFHHVWKTARGLPGLHASVDVTHIQLAYDDLAARIAPACASGGMHIKNVEGCCIFHPGLWLAGAVAHSPHAAHSRAMPASPSPVGCVEAGSGASQRMQRCKVPPQLAAEAEALNAAVLVSCSKEAPIQGIVILLRLTASGGSLGLAWLPACCSAGVHALCCRHFVR